MGVNIIHSDSKMNAQKAHMSGFGHIHFNRIRWHDSFQFWMLTFHNLNNELRYFDTTKQ